jgi:hypothetical protein
VDFAAVRVQLNAAEHFHAAEALANAAHANQRDTIPIAHDEKLQHRA